MSDAHLSPIAQANLLAGHAVAYAAAFLGDRHDARKLAANADAVDAAAFRLALDHPETNVIINLVRMLATAMKGTALSALDPTQTQARNDRWQAAMASVVELVCDYSRDLKKD